MCAERYSTTRTPRFLRSGTAVRQSVSHNPGSACCCLLCLLGLSSSGSQAAAEGFARASCGNKSPGELALIVVASQSGRKSNNAAVFKTQPLQSLSFTLLGQQHVFGHGARLKVS